ncbi:MAG: glycosyltransferase family 4 protein, partial [Chloroflexota bacterium]|nr:glycosyltransferase family 4 protein [Chloroflexota bacterium]
AVSRALASELVARRIPRSRIAVIPPGVGRTRVARRVDSGHALCVANWTREKGIRTLLAAIEWLPDVRLDLVGDTPDPVYARQIRAHLRRAALRGRVREIGVMRGAALRRLYARASFFVLPSVVESYGMAVGEALTAGLPVIACDIPATREVTAGAALLVPPGRVDPLSRAIALVHSDSQLRRDLSARARARAKELPTWTQSGRAFVRELRALSARGADDPYLASRTHAPRARARRRG